MTTEYATYRRMADLMGRPTSSAWREEALTSAAEMYTLLHWMEGIEEEEGEIPVPNKSHLAEAVAAHLDAARQGAHTRGWQVWRTWSGAVIERTMGNLDAAQINLLRLAPMSFLRSAMPNLLMTARQYLKENDPRLNRLESFARRAEQIRSDDRGFIVAAVQGALTEGRRGEARIRSFRNVIMVTSAILIMFAIGIAILGWFQPTLLPICFRPGDAVVCPTDEVALPPSQVTPQGAPSTFADIGPAIDEAASPWDALLVEFVGLLGATVAAAAALRRLRGTTDPYSLPAALSVLKVGTGALTAFLGMLLIRAAFIPGFTALDSSEQIIGWAIVFGYAQQLFTRTVDQQAENILASARSVVAGPIRPEPTPSPSPEVTSSRPSPEATS
jgi:hypothetical protein